MLDEFGRFLHLTGSAGGAVPVNTSVLLFRKLFISDGLIMEEYPPVANSYREIRGSNPGLGAFFFHPRI